MEKHKIQGEIMKLIHSGETNFANCEKLVLLEKTLKCLEKYEEKRKEYEHHKHSEHHHEDLTKEQIMCWVADMENADGTHGGHWPMEQTEQVRKQKKIDCDPLMFFAAMNMMYSDYCKAVENANASSVDIFVYMAKAFLDNKDAMPHKLERYYRYIAEK
ncbi:MAG: hypothetical protein HDT14_13795 [Oscillibacter sp.]|nr:hypothetical protein [Oscillibacter sp.]